MGKQQPNYGNEALAWENAKSRAATLAAFLKKECDSDFDEDDFVERASKVFFEEEFYKLL